MQTKKNSKLKNAVSTIYQIELQNDSGQYIIQPIFFNKFKHAFAFAKSLAKGIKDVDTQKLFLSRVLEKIEYNKNGQADNQIIDYFILYQFYKTGKVKKIGN